MYSLQTSVQVGQASFRIRNDGDFRTVLDCFEVLNDEELDETERLYAALVIFYEDFDTLGDLFVHRDILDQLQLGMYRFFNCGEQELKSNTNEHKLVDWKKDSNIICAAVNNVAKCEVRSLEYLHWWTFFGYYMSVGESVLSNVVSIRYKIAHNEKLEKYERKFREDNPEYFNIDLRSKEQKEAEDYIKNLWFTG